MSVTSQRLENQTILTTNDPQTLLRRLESHRRDVALVLRRPHNLTPSGYDVECMKNDSTLVQDAKLFDLPGYPEEDLSGGSEAYVVGPWDYPLSFSFPNLVLLDLAMDDAVLWLIPILNTMTRSSPFRRLLLRFCDDWALKARPFPFEALDFRLKSLPDVRVLVGFAEDGDVAFVGHFKKNLPQLKSEGRLAIIYTRGEFFSQLSLYVAHEFLQRSFHWRWTTLDQNWWIRTGGHTMTYTLRDALTSGRGCMNQGKIPLVTSSNSCVHAEMKERST